MTDRPIRTLENCETELTLAKERITVLEDELAKIDELIYDGMMHAEDIEHYIEQHSPEDVLKLLRAIGKVMYDLKAVTQPRIDKIMDEMEEQHADRRKSEEGK